MTALATHEPFAPISWGVRLAAHLPQRTIVTVTTNVPGPRKPLYLCGRKAVEILPYVPIATRLRSGISVFSYCDQLTFGVTGDFEHMPEVDFMARAIAQSVQELVDLYPPPRPPKQTRQPVQRRATTPKKAPAKGAKRANARVS
jgi:diacylglycerol O-acyltransferase